MGMTIATRFYDTVTVEEFKGQPAYEMKCHVSYTQSWEADSDVAGMAFAVGIMRITFPAEYELKPNQTVDYFGQVWSAYVGDQVHSRRGKIAYRTADLKRLEIA